MKSKKSNKGGYMAEKEKKAEPGKSTADNPNAIVAQFQIMQQQLQNVLIQKESLRVNIMEIDRAAEELEKSNDGTAYKITGAIMVKKPTEDIKKDLKDTKEALNVRMTSLKKTEKQLTTKLNELQEKLKEILK